MLVGCTILVKVSHVWIEYFTTLSLGLDPWSESSVVWQGSSILFGLGSTAQILSLLSSSKAFEEYEVWVYRATCVAPDAFSGLFRIVPLDLSSPPACS